MVGELTARVEVLYVQQHMMNVCMECGSAEEEGKEEPRMLGLALIPGRHVVCICLDTSMSM